eukprot:CAMPEP_0175161370 /NCGR_PEP_ID=MMETSP0087-20121206/24568_1 /TAXON_ID=136419 /ORGANISM="Unknown Unknown, Strain D1" /LENGTH=510 /DNA_ID=CAMNT_0016449779 /DNA_START=40 /DNA_END=1573 /DNA_ORIENTATION=+
MEISISRYTPRKALSMDEKCAICEKAFESTDTSIVVAVPTRKLRKLATHEIKSLVIPWNPKWQHKSSDAEDKEDDDDEEEPCRSQFHQACWKEAKKKVTLAKEKRAVKLAQKTLERFDSIETLKQQAKTVAELLKNSKRSMVVSGAGISVTAGIPTYRGTAGIDTCHSLQRQDSGLEGTSSPSKSSLSAENKLRKLQEEEQSTREYEDAEEEDQRFLEMRPTLCHLALTLLNKKGLLHYIATSNCDDLHGKAGFPRQDIDDMHGNRLVEYCEKCNKEYPRNFCVDAWSTAVTQEKWFVNAEGVAGTIIRLGSARSRDAKANSETQLSISVRLFQEENRFKIAKQRKGERRESSRGCCVAIGDHLRHLDRPEEESKQADLIIVIGSSLTVTPSSDLPRKAKAVVICNLQKTYMDKKRNCKVRVWGSSDLLFQLVIEELGFAGDLAKLETKEQAKRKASKAARAKREITLEKVRAARAKKILSEANKSDKKRKAAPAKESKKSAATSKKRKA